MTRVLLVDDREDNLYYLTALLGTQGCDVEAARHGAEALVKARKAPPDVVISDLLMPVMDGYTLLRHWKSDDRLKHVPFIVYTATYTEPEDEQLALNLGADAFILKPAEPEAFVRRLRQVLASASALVPTLPAKPSGDDQGLFREYSEILIRKLEAKTLQLEESNQTLQKDIAARELVEAALRESEAKFRLLTEEASERAAVLDALFSSVPDVVTHVGLDGRIQHINRVRTPLDRGELVDGSWMSADSGWASTEHRDAMKRAFDSVVETGKPASLELNTPGVNGSTTVVWNTIGPVVRNKKTTGVVVVARDITERKQTEAQLIVSDRMASVGTLAAGVAHEINNPLSCVTANLALATQELETLARMYPVSGDLMDEIRDARDGAERVRMIVRDLKIFSRGDEAKVGPVNVEDVLESTLRMAWNEVRHRARLTKNYGKVPPVKANESRLGQVLLNLIVNAAQAIPEGNYQRNEVHVETRIDAENRRVIVCISDTGSGIPPEVQRRLFTPFVTTKAVGVGTGLGLSICHRIVNSLGGTIDFTSEVGKGTTFRVALPMANLDVAIESAPVGALGPANRRARVLVIDDDVAIAGAIKRLLSSDHEVRVVQGAKLAMELFVAGDRFDVILCDLMMPQVTGMDLYAWLFRLDRQQVARIVFMTGGAFTPTARAFLDGVTNQRIEKPFEVQGLRALVNGFAT